VRAFFHGYFQLVKILPSFLPDKVPRQRNGGLFADGSKRKGQAFSQTPTWCATLLTALLTVQTLPTPAIEKYHPNNQFTHFSPRYFTIVNSPINAMEPICSDKYSAVWICRTKCTLTIGKSHASPDVMRSMISSSSSSSSSFAVAGFRFGG